MITAFLNPSDYMPEPAAQQLIMLCLKAFSGPTSSDRLAIVKEAARHNPSWIKYFQLVAMADPAHASPPPPEHLLTFGIGAVLDGLQTEARRVLNSM